jgi:hypothetical protein
MHAHPPFPFRFTPFHLARATQTSPTHLCKLAGRLGQVCHSILQGLQELLASEHFEHDPVTIREGGGHLGQRYVAL